MDTQKKLNKLDKSVFKWIKQWVQSPTNRELFLTEPANLISEFLKDRAEYFLLAQTLFDLSTWHLINFENDLMSGDQKSPHLCLASTFSGASLELSRHLISQGINESILPNNASLSLGLAAITNHKEDFTTRYEIIVEGLTTPLLDFSTLNSPNNGKGELFTHLWFMLLLYSKTTNEEIDLSNLSHPTSMPPYKRALDNWNTTNEQLLQAIISEMAEYHLANTIATTPDDIAEFDYEYTMLLPFEIITFLQIRTWNGLVNPETFNHPLMNHPLSFHQTNTHTHTTPEIIHKIIEKIKDRN